MNTAPDVAQCSQPFRGRVYFLSCIGGYDKADDVMAFIFSFFEEAKFPWNKLVGLCNDGAPAMLGSRSGFITQVKQRNPEVFGTLHDQIRASCLKEKKLPGWEQRFN